MLVYRVDAANQTPDFDPVNDGFRARKWIGPPMFNHSNLANIKHQNAGVDIYRICFFTSLEHLFARCSGFSGQFMIHAVEHDEITALGFLDSWDDGFPDGVAHLFHLTKPKARDNGEFSRELISGWHVKRMCKSVTFE